MLEIDIVDRRPPFELRVELKVGTGELLVLYGPSGAGKSTLLSVIAGFRQPVAGRIRLGDRFLFRREVGYPRWNLPLQVRRVAFVSQDLHLFPHLTVAEHLAYGARGEWRDLAGRLGLEGLLDRRPDRLSGGERQRVALGRALAARPELLLLDEPFANLEGPLRYRLGRLVQELQANLGLTTILVTHSFAEAARLGKRLAVMEGGRLRQTGPLGEILRQPADRRVAELVGYLNFLPVARRGAEMMVVREEQAEFILALDPRAWRLSPPAGPHLRWQGRLRASAEGSGGVRSWLVDPEGRELTVDSDRAPGEVGREISVYAAEVDWRLLAPERLR